MSPFYGSSAPSSLSPLAWAYFGRVDIVAAAQGKFQPMGQVKVVEPLETGRVENIRVGNGALVRAGEVLVEFDRSAALADAEGARAELASAKAEILRRKTALLSAQSRSFDPAPAIDWPDDAAPALRERETRVLAADLGQLAATVAAFDAERRQKTAEADKLRETIATQKNLVATLQERVNMRTKLVEEKAGAKAAVIDATETLQYQITQEAKQEQDLVFLDRRARGHRPQRREGGPGLHLRATPGNSRTPSGASKTSRSASPRLTRSSTI